MRQLIDSISHGVPAALTEVITLGRTLPKRAGDILGQLRPTTSPDHYSRPADSDHHDYTRL